MRNMSLASCSKDKDSFTSRDFQMSCLSFYFFIEIKYQARPNASKHFPLQLSENVLRRTTKSRKAPYHLFDFFWY